MIDSSSNNSTGLQTEFPGFLTVPLNISIFVLCRTSRLLEKCPNAQGKPPEEKGQFVPPTPIHSPMTHILFSSRIQPVCLSAHTLSCPFPHSFFSSQPASLSFLHACINLPVSWFPTCRSVPLLTQNFCCSLKAGPRRSLSLDSYAVLSLCLVVRDIYAPSTYHCSSDEPHP